MGLPSGLTWRQDSRKHHIQLRNLYRCSVNPHLLRVACPHGPRKTQAGMGDCSAPVDAHRDMCQCALVDALRCGRWGLWAPGAIGLVVGALILFTITDDPESAGFEAVESAPVKQGAPLELLLSFAASHHIAM